MRRDSLRLRLGLAASGLIALALVLAGIGLTLILDRVLDARTVEELDRTAKLIAGRVGLAPDGAPTLSRDLPDPRFATPYGGLYWQVEAGSHLLRSRSLWDKSLDLSRAGTGAQAPATLDTTGPDGGRLIAVVRPVQIGAQGSETALRVAVAEDRRSLAASRSTFLHLLIPALIALFESGEALELARALLPDPAQRMQEPLGVVLALGVARDLGADHPGGVVVVLGPAHASDGALVEKFHLERAGRRAIVRAGGIADPLGLWEPDGLIHPASVVERI